MTWLQIDVLEMLFEGARQRLVELQRPLQPRVVGFEEACAARAAARHLEEIRLPHPASTWGARAFNHLI